MTMKLLRALAFPALLLAAACGGDPTAGPSAPTPAASNPSPAPPPPTLVTRHLNGLVLDESGILVPGASVEVFSATPAAVTDGNGYYDLAATLLVSGNVFGTDVTITKGGHEDTHQWVPGRNDVTQNFRLYRIVNITAGQAVHLAITPDNSLCGLGEEFRCRMVHVVMPSSGTLVLDTIGDDPSTAFWIIVGERFNVRYPFHGVTHLSISMNERSTVSLQVLRPWQDPPAPQGFTLTTSLTP